jgi:hypothetical protein
VRATRAAVAGILVAGTLAGIAGATAQAATSTPAGDMPVDVTVPSLPATNTPVDGVVDTVTGTVNGAAGTVGSAVGSVAGGDLGGVVDTVTGAVGGTPVDGVLDPVLDNVTGALDGGPGNEAGATDALSGLLAPITGLLGGGSGNEATDPLSGLLGGLLGGGSDPAAGVSDPLKDLLTQVVSAITSLEDQICASPLGDILRQLHEALDPVLTPVKSALYQTLESVFDALGTALMNEDIKLTPIALETIIDKLACPKAPTTYAGGETVKPAAKPAETPASSQGGTLPFTGAGALALAGLGGGLVGGGHLFRRLGARRRQA